MGILFEIVYNHAPMNRPNLFRVITASSLGTILEWYDFSLFAFLAPVLAKLFFPQNNALAALMLTYASFAIGYFVRPLGAMLFGHFGDKLGRKKTLIWSIVLMSLPTFFMGLLPTYKTVGIAAPILLVILRLCQGLSAGGETTGSILFVLESVPSQRRGMMGALSWSMVGIGMLLGSFASTIVAQHADITWAWRVPFLLGLATGLIGYFLRKRTVESDLFKQAHQENRLTSYPLREAFTHYRKEIAIITGLYILSAMITYLIFIFMPSFAANIIGMPLAKTSLVTTCAYLCSTLFIPVGGYLSDKIGRDKCLRWSALGFIFLSYPLFKLISQGGIEQLVFAECIFVLLAIVFQGTLNAAVFEMVPTAVRYSVAAVGYNVSYSLFGGTAPFVAAYIVHLTGNQSAPGIYLVFGAVIALIAIQKMRSNPQLKTH